MQDNIQIRKTVVRMPWVVMKCDPRKRHIVKVRIVQFQEFKLGLYSIETVK
jgi:hypothetical protein